MKTAIDGAAAAFRCVTDYQPAGGPGDKVFPPTYEGGKYATEERIDPETGKRRPCVLLDSVQSQANRMELALLEAHRAEKVELPLLVTRFNQEELLRKFTVTSLEAPRTALERLAAKVTHVGHSASFVQVWLETNPPPPAWIPATGVALQRLRVTSPGRLKTLETRMNRAAGIAYQDILSEIEQAETNLKAMKHPPPRVPWAAFADAVLLAGESQTKRHPEYAGAKTGEAVAAATLVNSLVDQAGIAKVQVLVSEVSESGEPVLVCANAYERQGFNAIPAALAKLLSERLGAPFDTTVVQTNVVSHTGADGYGRRSAGRIRRQGPEGMRIRDGRRFHRPGRYAGESTWLDRETRRQGRRSCCADRQTVLC